MKTESITKAVDGSVKVVIGGKEYYTELKNVKFNDRSLDEVLKSIQDEFKSSLEHLNKTHEQDIKNIENTFRNKIVLLEKEVASVKQYVVEQFSEIAKVGE